MRTKPDPRRSRACRTVGHSIGVSLHDARDGGLTSRPDLKSDTENMRTVSGGAAVPTLKGRYIFGAVSAFEKLHEGSAMQSE